MATNANRTDAAAKRRRIHNCVARNDMNGLRKAINELYDKTESPLISSGGVKRIESFAAMVEAWILAVVLRPNTALAREMCLNVMHTHVSFGMSNEDYLMISNQVESCSPDEFSTTEWCKGTALEGIAKPTRHIKLFADTDGGVMQHVPARTLGRIDEQASEGKEESHVQAEM